MRSRDVKRCCTTKLGACAWRVMEVVRPPVHGTLSKLRKLSIDQERSAFDDVGGDLSPFHLVILRTERVVDARKSRDHSVSQSFVENVAVNFIILSINPLYS